MILPRLADTAVRAALDRQAAVALIGPRQVGKTTLARGIGDERGALYLDLESREDRDKLASPRLYLERLADRLVILDEIHRMPEIFESLRGIIDEGRRGGRGTGRFLILGSASIDLLRQSGESLAGRIAYVDLPPLTALEVAPGRADLGKRLVKSPKVYVRDSGLVHALLDIVDLDRLAGHPVVGTSWEGFVIETLCALLPDRTQPLFYRTAAGAEIDLLLERPDGRLWAIEIKRALTAKPRRGFYVACEDLKPARAFVVYAGDERYPVAEGVEAIGVREMAALVAGA